MTFNGSIIIYLSQTTSIEILTIRLMWYQFLDVWIFDDSIKPKWVDWIGVVALKSLLWMMTPIINDKIILINIVIEWNIHGLSVWDCVIGMHIFEFYDVLQHGIGVAARTILMARCFVLTKHSFVCSCSANEILWLSVFLSTPVNSLPPSLSLSFSFSLPHTHIFFPPKTLITVWCSYGQR